MPSTLDFELTSEHRRVPIWQYARGEGFPWEQFLQDIKAASRERNNYDMLHALNWISSNMKSSESVETPKNEERSAANEVWCFLYPQAPASIKAHMLIMLHDSYDAQSHAMQAHPHPWLQLLHNVWADQDDMALWSELCRRMPKHMGVLPLQSDSMENAIALLRPQVHEWIGQSDTNETISDMLYKALLRRAKPELQQTLQTFQLLYPSIDDMPKGNNVVKSLDKADGLNTASRAKLDYCMQLMSNVLALNEQRMQALELPVLDLPDNGFELPP